MSNGGQDRAKGAEAGKVYDVSIPGKAVIRPRKGLLAREPKTAARVAAFNELHENLAVATEIFLHRGDGGRQGVYDATRALISYLTGQGVPYAALEPLIAMQTAVVDADHGTASPIFAPSRKPAGGKPPKSDMLRAFDGILAAVMECCVQHCKAKGERPYVGPAARLAAKMTNESALPVKVTARQMEELRERIQQTEKGSPDRALTDAALQSDVAKAFPLKWAQCLLSSELVNPPAKLSE